MCVWACMHEAMIYILDWPTRPNFSLWKLGLAGQTNDMRVEPSSECSPELTIAPRDSFLSVLHKHTVQYGKGSGHASLTQLGFF